MPGLGRSRTGRAVAGPLWLNSPQPRAPHGTSAHPCALPALQRPRRAPHIPSVPRAGSQHRRNSPHHLPGLTPPSPKPLMSSVKTPGSLSIRHHSPALLPADMAAPPPLRLRGRAAPPLSRQDPHHGEAGRPQEADQLRP